MKNPQTSEKKLTSLLRKLKKEQPAEPEEFSDAVEVLVKSFLIWESTTIKASAAYKRIMDQIVDFNDLRVSMPQELVDWIGPRYPMALERSQRIRAALRHTYHREHSVSLKSLHGMGRREVRHYLRSMDGVAPYVADRVTLLCFDAHCIPVDDRLQRSMVGAGVCDDSMTVADLSSWLARQVKAADAVPTHYALQAWSDSVGSGASGARSTARARSTRTKKKTAGARG